MGETWLDRKLPACRLLKEAFKSLLAENEADKGYSRSIN